LDIVYDHTKVKAAIVTCGGLCPGLNTVIREIVMSLHFNYEVKEIYGIKWGYKGFYEGVAESNYTEYKHWIRLQPQDVKKIHQQGGTMLGSSRGGFNGVKDADRILDALDHKGVN